MPLPHAEVSSVLPKEGCSVARTAAELVCCFVPDKKRPYGPVPPDVQLSD